MKILFKTEGGFGYFPGLNKPLEINSNDLPAEEESHLERLVQETAFFDLPNQPDEPVKGADRQQYHIKVEAEGREHWIQVSDTTSNPPLQNLVKYLSDKRKEQRAGNKPKLS